MSNEKPKGINFRVLVHQLTPKFKMNVMKDNIKLSDVFILSDKGEAMLKNLIEEDYIGNVKTYKIKDTNMAFCENYQSESCDCTSKCESLQEKKKKYFGLF